MNEHYDEIEVWAIQQRELGIALPQEREILENLFHIARMRNEKVPIDIRVMSRQFLLSRGVLKEPPPLTVYEVLRSRQAMNLSIVPFQKLLFYPQENIYLLYPNESMRTRDLKRMLKYYTAIDEYRSSLKSWVLTTKTGKRFYLRLVTDYEAEIPEGSAYKVVLDVT